MVSSAMYASGRGR